MSYLQKQLECHSYFIFVTMDKGIELPWRHQSSIKESRKYSDQYYYNWESQPDVFIGEYSCLVNE